MAYSMKVVKTARERLASMKADRESVAAQHLAQAYAKVPRLAEIDRLLRQTMASAVQTAFARGEDVQSAIQALKEENLNLQKERKALVDTWFEPGWLDESPVCTRCGGSGYVGSAMCECLTELCRQEQQKELTLLSGCKDSFRDFRLDYYPDDIDPKWGVSVRTVMERTFNACKKYAENFGENSGNLLFSGDTGLGKTFLSACIARSVADRGFSVVYESAGHLFSCMERATFTGAEQAREESDRFPACALLIVDDLGTEMAGQFTTAALYSIINDRILVGKATIISTNLNTEDLSRRYNSQITSRLRGNFQRLAFLGEDIRLKKGMGQI